ncbi:hypothetical protein HK104_008791 [Borealophlyctis nickersoniae]|nr:hypothetical protein HK104_008791 [Borealophlyctis nickersoniae]
MQDGAPAPQTSSVAAGEAAGGEEAGNLAGGTTSEAVGNPPPDAIVASPEAPSLSAAEEAVASTVAAATPAVAPTPALSVPQTPMKIVPGLEEKLAQDDVFKVMGAEFESTLKLVQDDDTFAKFRAEYEKMYRAALRSRDHSQKLFSQYEMYHDEYLVNEAQKQESVKTSVQDQQTLKTLRGQIKRGEEMVEASNKREELSKEELRQLRADINNLNATLKQGVGLSVVQERTLQELLQTKEQATKELEQELEKIVRLRNSIAEMSEKIKTADQEKRDLEREIYDLKEKGAAKKADIDAEMRNKERLERDLRELRVVVAVKSQEVRGKQDAVNRATDDISILESQIKTQRQLIEKLAKDEESLTVRTLKLQEEADQQMTMTSQLIQENENARAELKQREATLAKTLGELKKVGRIKEALAKKIRALEDQKLEAEMERKAIRAECEATLAEMDNQKHQLDVTRKNIDDLMRERDILQGNYAKAQNETQRSAHMSLLCRQTRHNIELELGRYNREASDLTKLIRQLESDRDGYIAEATRLQSLCVAGLQQIKEKELEIFEYKKRTMQAHTKLKHQQNLYEAVQSDRNLHSKHLVESQSEIAEMKRKLKIMNFQINGFKEDINSKDAALAQEAAEKSKLDKDIEVITEEIKTLKNQIELAHAYIKSQIAEETKLTQFVKEAEVERSRQENALQVLISERDNLSNQLIRRNEELAKVYDKIKAQQSELIRSEIHYRDRLRVISDLREEMRRLRSENMALESQTSTQRELKNTICKLETDLIHERTRMKALEQELQNPINVHRWRKLEGSNPKAFEMIQLLHTLQKKLIAKSKEDQEKERLITSKEELYLHLKSLLAKQVGPEAVEQVADYKQILKEKSAQLNHMDTELNMYQAQVREHRYAIAQLDKGMKEVRAKFLKTYKGTLGAGGKGGRMGMAGRGKAAVSVGIPTPAEYWDEDDGRSTRSSRRSASSARSMVGEEGTARAAEGVRGGIEGKSSKDGENAGDGLPPLPTKEAPLGHRGSQGSAVSDEELSENEGEGRTTVVGIASDGAKLIDSAKEELIQQGTSGAGADLVPTASATTMETFEDKGPQ